MRPRLLHFVLILGLHYCCVGLDSEKFALEAVKLLPCTDLSSNVSLHNSAIVTVPANLTFCNFSRSAETDQYNLTNTVVSWAKSRCYSGFKASCKNSNRKTV